MEQNTIMNEEMVEDVVENVSEEVVSTKTGKVVKIGVGVAIATLGGVLLYKKVLKPLAAKIKAKRAARKETITKDVTNTEVRTVLDDIDDGELNTIVDSND